MGYDDCPTLILASASMAGPQFDKSVRRMLGGMRSIHYQSQKGLTCQVWTLLIADLQAL